MIHITELLNSAGMPSPLRGRDHCIHRAINSFFPLYLDLCDSLGAYSGNLTAAVNVKSEPQIYDGCIHFLNKSQLPYKCCPLNGDDTPYDNQTARRNFLVWVSGKTLSGSFQPFLRDLKIQYPDLVRRSSRNEQLALFSAKIWKQMPELCFSWNAVSRSLYQPLEGSNRRAQGSRFEEAIREAVMQACDSLFLSDAIVSRKEVAVIGDNDKSSRIDVVVTCNGDAIYFPCKSTQVGSSTHSSLFMRDVHESLKSIGIEQENVLMILGGLGWQKVVKDESFSKLWIRDIDCIDDHFIAAIRDEIIDTGILSKFLLKQ